LLLLLSGCFQEFYRGFSALTLRFFPLRFFPLRFFPLRFFPLRFFPLRL